MSFKKNKGVSRKEANLDDASLNLLMVVVAVTLIFLIVLASYLIIINVSAPDTPGENERPASTDYEYPFRVDGISIELPSSRDAEFGIAESDVNSDFAILVDVTDKKIVASLRGESIIVPASMTKVMSLIIIAENIKSEAVLDEKITITQELMDIKVSEKHSGFTVTEVGEVFTIKDLIYAFVLDSEGIAGITLAKYLCGSEYNFVQLMNEKAKDMGLTKTYFVDCTGINSSTNQTTCREMAMIMMYAMENPFCAKVLSTLGHEISTNVHPKLTTWHKFLHVYLDDGKTQPKKAEIIAGKTGLTEKDTSGCCIVTYARGDNGHVYVSVTAKAESWTANVDDILNIYDNYVK